MAEAFAFALDRNKAKDNIKAAFPFEVAFLFPFREAFPFKID